MNTIDNTLFQVKRYDLSTWIRTCGRSDIAKQIDDQESNEEVNVVLAENETELRQVCNQFDSGDNNDPHYRASVLIIQRLQEALVQPDKRFQ